MTVGQLAIATGLARTYVPQPEVHGLAVLMFLGVAFIAQMVASKVDEQQRAAAELLASGADVRQPFAANPQPMWVEDLQGGGFLAVNEAAVRHYGWPRRVFLEMRASDLRLDPSTRADLRAGMTWDVDNSQRDTLVIGRLKPDTDYCLGIDPAQARAR